MIPEIEITEQPLLLLHSAANVEPLLTKYKLMTSMERAAIAMIAIMATATSTMVTPRSGCGGDRENLGIAGGFIPFFSFRSLLRRLR